MSSMAGSTVDVLDRAVADLVASRDRWARLPIGDKRRYLDQARQRTLRVMDRWVAITLEAKEIDPASRWAASEWGSGPYYFMLGLTALHDTLTTLLQDRPLRVPRIRTRRDGRVVATVYPATMLDRVLTGPLTAEVWMQPDVTKTSLPDTMATFYRQSEPEGKVALVLGAGNVVALGLWDVLHKLYVEGQVVILKTNPVVDYMTPVLEEVLGPWIDDAYVRLVSGGAEVGAHLVEHPDVDEIHLTGGLATHDAIVFGTGPDGDRRKAANQPRIDKRVTSELGGASPIIVVPGPWTRADIAAQAEKIVGMKLNNSGHNCMSPQVLVLPDGWPPAGRLVDEIERQMRVLPPQRAYYPGTEQRQRTLIDQHPDAIEIDNANVPRTLLRDLDPDATDEPAFTCEAFGPVLAQTSLPAPTPAAYLRQAVAFANDQLLGTLAATLLVHPTTARHVDGEIERALEELNYGTVAINDWHMWAGLLPQCPWGGAPGQPLNDVQSGRGFVHNSLMFDRPAKTIIRNSFHLAPRAWRYGQPQMLDRPSYSAARPYGPATGRKLTVLAANPQWHRLPGLLAAMLTGR